MKQRSTLLKKLGYACLVGGSVLATEIPARAADQVNLALDWVVDGVHANYFVALDKGFYKDAGLDVTVSRGFGSGDTVKRVASGGATWMSATSTRCCPPAMSAGRSAEDSGT